MMAELTHVTAENVGEDPAGKAPNPGIEHLTLDLTLVKKEDLLQIMESTPTHAWSVASGA